MLVVAVINADACTFLAFSDLTCHLQDTDQTWKYKPRASPTTGKNTKIVLAIALKGIASL